LVEADAFIGDRNGRNAVGVVYGDAGPAGMRVLPHVGERFVGGAAHIRLPAGQHTTLTLPIPPTPAQLRKTPAAAVTAVDELLDHHTHAQIAGILNARGLTSGEGRPFHRLIIRNIRDEYGLRSREQRLRDAGMLTLTEMAGRLGVPAKTVKIWHHAGLITGHPCNDKGQCLYPPPGENPPTRAQGRKLSERRPAAPAHDA
jgi:hypothetical protein